MAEFSVLWEIDITADNHIEAARLALEIHRDPTSIATVFKVVQESSGEVKIIDALNGMVLKKGDL